jgi:methyl-accepting chemotaxis protein
VTTDLAHLRKIAPAYVTAGASAEEQAALKVIMALADSYDAALPKAAEVVARGEGARKGWAAAPVDNGPALAALDKLGELLKHEHLASADRVDDATWTVSATVGGVMLLNALLLLLLAIFFFWFTRFRIVRPLDRLGGVMMHLAKGDKSVGVPLVAKEDEIGDMARAVEVFKESMIRTDELEAQKRAADAQVMERARRREALTENFGQVAMRLLQVVHGSVEKVREAAEALSAVAEETGRQADTVAQSARSATANVEEVAAAAEQLGGSGSEIHQGVGQSTIITREAVEAINGLVTTMGSLEAAAGKIGEIVTLIGEIAAQTNLLALNASIEAQRAGDAGRGFAVVANAVKELAGQTARATSEISEQIGNIQGTTRAAMSALHAVHGTVMNADDVVSNIALAVESQNTATESIVANVVMAADGNREVTSAIVEVSEAAVHTGRMAADMVAVTEALRSEADTMKAEVEKFLAAVNAT